MHVASCGQVPIACEKNWSRLRDWRMYGHQVLPDCSAAFQVLPIVLPLDLQVEKKHLLARVLRLNCDIDSGSIQFSSDEIQGKIDRWRVHPAKAMPIDWEETPKANEDSPEHLGITVCTDATD